MMDNKAFAEAVMEHFAAIRRLCKENERKGVIVAILSKGDYHESFTMEQGSPGQYEVDTLKNMISCLEENV